MEIDTNYVQIFCHVKIMYRSILTNKFTQIGVRIYMLCGVHGIIYPCKKCASPLTTTLIQIVPFIILFT
jgi:hypothetical protein